MPFVWGLQGRTAMKTPIGRPCYVTGVVQNGERHAQPHPCRGRASHAFAVFRKGAGEVGSGEGGLRINRGRRGVRA